MASNQAITTGEGLKLMKVFANTVLTSYPAMQIQYCGTCTYASVTVASGGDMTLKADNVDGATTTVHTIDLSTPGATVDTFGELKDVINAYGDFRCFLIGVLGSESTDNTLATLSITQIKTGATQAIKDNGLTLYMDQAVLLDTGFAITNQKFTYQPALGYDTLLKGWTTDELCENSLNYLYFSIATQANNGSIKVYSCDDTCGVNSSTLLWSNAYAAGTAEEHGATTNPDDTFLKAIRGHRLCVKFDAVDTAGSGALDVHAIGYTKHVTGGAVYGGNYTGCT